MALCNLASDHRRIENALIRANAMSSDKSDSESRNQSERALALLVRV